MSAEGSSSSSAQVDPSEKAEVMKKADGLLAQGKRNMVCGEVMKAVSFFEEAVKILVSECGEMSRDCADAYYNYGGALLELGRIETNVLGTALDGVDIEEENDEGESESDQFEKPPADDGEERQKLREQVYDAMCEDIRKEAKKENGSNAESGVNGDVDMEGQDQAETLLAESGDKGSEKDEKKSDSDEKKLDSDEKKLDSDEKKSDSDEKKLDSDEKKSDSDEKKLDSDEKKSDSDEKKLGNDEKKSGNDEKESQSNKETASCESGMETDATESKDNVERDTATDSNVGLKDEDRVEKNALDTDSVMKDEDCTSAENREQSKVQDTSEKTVERKQDIGEGNGKTIDNEGDSKKDSDMDINDKQETSSESNKENKDEPKPKVDNLTENGVSEKKQEKSDADLGSDDCNKGVKCQSFHPLQDVTEINEVNKEQGSDSEGKKSDSVIIDKKEKEKEQDLEKVGEEEAEEVQTGEKENDEEMADDAEADNQDDDGENEGEEEENEEDGEKENEEDAADKENPEAEGTEEKDGDDLGHFQLAWEHLDIAKVLYSKKEEKGDQLKAAECLIKLGELGMEIEQHETAATDLEAALVIQKKYLAEDNRSLAETHYQLGLAYSLTKEFEKAIQAYQSAISVIEAKIVSLNKLIEEKEEGADNKENCETDALMKYKEEIKELQEIIPEMRNKIEDTKVEERDLQKMREMACEMLGLSSASKGFGSPSKRVNLNGAGSSESADVDENGEKKPKDIAHLVRRKKKTEEPMTS
ncbi:nuclear autoantigenic sperm protein isoform X2 [Aplysia californica]|uniref:Nuclear autoantigenic sperm protein isoform X2 n=1 Tax=Aplysia californica TaxID=6500 RepID=A0ABM1A894_APLCA|nr:nuclear autoantigenic sperm protein isoform X2 [Aplysia californica]